MNKEHGIVYPSTAVHISTLPLKLRKKMKQREKKEAISASSQTAQLRTPVAKKKESKTIQTQFPFIPAEKIFSLRESNNHNFKNHSFQVVLIREGMGNFKDRFFYTKTALQAAAKSKLFEGTQCYADHPSKLDEEILPERSTRDILGYYDKVEYQESDDGTGLLIGRLNVANSISLDWAMALLTNSIDYSTKFRETDLVGLSINASGSASPVSIDDLMSQSLSDSIMNKLMEAKSQGITEVNIVNQLRDAVSVDLVTKAGAGGKILKMLEMEKSMKTKVRESDDAAVEKKKEGALEDASAMAPKSQGTPEHADAEQDKELFAKMIKQYLGKDDADAEEMEMAKHAYDAHKEEGMEHEAAYEGAGKHLKMAMSIGKKMAHKTEDDGGMESEKESTEESDAEEKKETKGKPMEHKKESAKVIQLSGEVAKLRESVKKYELRDYLDEKCKTSGESNSVTKKFREALGVVKSKEQIDQTWEIFMKAFKAGSEEVGSDSGFLMTEKKSYRESAVDSKGTSFGDCLR